MPTNILGPGHYPNTNETATRPTPVATLKNFLAWFAQCDANGAGGTNIDEQWLNALMASLRSPILNSGAQQDELSDDMIAEAMARYASGGVFCTDGGVANAYVLSTPLSFIMPKSYFLGQRLLWYPANANTGASTVNAFGNGAKAIRRPDDTALAGGELVAGRAVDMVYDPAANSGAGAFRLVPWSLANLVTTGGLLNLQLITATGTYTKTATAKKAIAIVVGGGGSGGGAIPMSSGVGLGGGAGGAAIAFVDLSAISTVACTIGPGGVAVLADKGGDGGTTSFGAYAVATGGKGGDRFDGTTDYDAPTAEGGMGTAGLLLFPGEPGGGGINGGGAIGGSSLFGGGGRPANVLPGPGADGYTPSGYGGGGGGADSGGSGGSNQKGGNGAPGCILVVEFA